MKVVGFMVGLCGNMKPGASEVLKTKLPSWS